MTLNPQDLIIQRINDAYAIRYFTAVGMVMMLHDHLLTISDECQYIWKAAPSFPKRLFLFNRYFVPAMQIVLANAMCGFNSRSYTDSGCRKLLSATAVLSLMSIAAANLLILLRVLLLWKESQKMRLRLYGVYCASLCTTIVLMVLVIIDLWDGTGWSTVVHMCVVETKTTLFGVLWGAPMFFEVTVFSMVMLNSLALPRYAHVRLVDVLRQDGIAFFLSVISLRTFNVILAFIGRPGLALLGVYFVWAFITLILNRSLLHMRKVELCELLQTPSTEPAEVDPQLGIPTQLTLTKMTQAEDTFQKKLRDMSSSSGVGARKYHPRRLFDRWIRQ